MNKPISTRYLENGVVFQSCKYPDVSYGTTYEEDNAIWHNISFEPPIGILPKKLINRNNLLVILIDILFIVISIIARNPVMIIGAILFSIFISFKLDKLGRKKFSQASKFHAAKHKVFNAWKAINYERVPTLEEAKNASHFSKECDDNPLLRDCLYYSIMLIIMICTTNHDLLFMILAILNIVLFIFAIKFDLIQYLQVLSINKPTDRELRLVIDALDEYLRVESSIKISVYEYEDVDVLNFTVDQCNENENTDEEKGIYVEDVVINQEAYKKETDPGE